MVEAIINLAALRSNARTVRTLAPNSAVMAVIKANAYGHGMHQVARALQTEVEGFSVARLTEALELRHKGIEQRLLVLSARPGLEQLRLCAQHNIDIVVHDTDTARLLSDCSLPKPVSVWLKMDSGMHRLGVAPADMRAVYLSLANAPSVGDIVLMSHFASAEETRAETTDEQIRRFDTATAGIDAPTSLANSAAIITRPDSHRQWVRPGIMLYGANPLGDQASPGLQAVMTLQAELLAVRDIGANEGVGYNHTWTSSHASRIGTVAVGYGDGYPRHAANGTPVLINGRRAPLAGRVSMDTITLDLTEHPGASPGDKVILWGDGLTVNEVADCADTIAYELLTRVTDRVDFIYQG